MKNSLMRLIAVVLVCTLCGVVANAAALVQKNVFAYDITVDKTDVYKPKVSYRLNGKAKNVKVRAYIGTTKVAEASGTANDGVNTVTLDLNNVTRSGQLSFKVYAETSTTVTTPTKVVEPNSPAFYNKTDIRLFRPVGVAVNNSTDSPLFGMIVATEATITDAANNAKVYHSSIANGGRGCNMMYAFNPRLEGIKNPQANAYGFNGGIGTPNEKHGAYPYVLHRPRFSEDGRLFLSSQDYKYYGVYEFAITAGDNMSNLQGLNGATPLFDGATLNTTDGTKKVGSVVVGGSGAGLDVYGKGENLVLVHGVASSMTAGSLAKQSINFYNLGTAKKWTKAPSKTIAASTDGQYGFIRPESQAVAIDADGKGVWHSNHAGNPRIAVSSTGGRDWDFSMVHYAADGTPTNYSVLTPNFKTIRCVTFNHDRTLMAVGDYSNGGVITVYQVTINGNNTPVLAEKCKIQVRAANLTTHINDLAFDYADNLYMVDNSSEVLRCYQLPASVAGTSREVPAPSSSSYAFESRSFVITDAVARWSARNERSGVQVVNLDWEEYGDAEKYEVYCNNLLVGTVEPHDEYDEDNNPTGNKILSTGMNDVVMPSFPADTPKDQVKAVFKIVAKDAAGNVLRTTPEREVYYKDIVNENTVLSTETNVNDKTGEATILVTWRPAKQGTATTATVRHNIAKYQLYRIDYDSEDNPKAGVLIDGDIPGDQTSYVITDAGSGKMSFMVTADTKYVYKTGATTYRDQILGSLSAPVTLEPRYAAPYIYMTKTFEGRNSVLLKWRIYNGGMPITKNVYYSVERDGVEVVTNIDARSTIDEQVPDGKHTYVVIFHYADGTTMASEPVTLDSEIMRDDANIQYGIEVVYNYPIVSLEDAEKLGYNNEDGDETTNAFIVDPDSDYFLNAGIGNFNYCDGQYGASGGLYRHAAYRNGKWYIAQLTDGDDVKHANNRDYIDYNTFVKKDKTPCKGGIIEFDANDPLGHTPQRVIELEPSTNQWVAGDETGNGFSFRLPAQNGMTPSATGDYIFYGATKRIGVAHQHEDGEWHVAEVRTPNLGKEYKSEDGEAQVGRVHYARATGDIWGEDGGYIYVALNKRNYMYRLHLSGGNIDNREDVQSGDAIIQLPEEFLTPRNANGLIGATENYAFPVAGRPDDIIYQIRSNGYFYYTGATGEFKRIFDEDESRNAGGRTFIYNDEVFMLHPSSIRSNNIGHFRIDMPTRTDKEADHTTGDFTDLIPIASYTQQELTTTTAANASGSWFGVEPNEEEGCVYIYQYVPGIRFAKYRFFSYEKFPAVKPTLDVQVQHNDDDTEVSHIDATIEWKRPQKYDFTEYNDYRIKNYLVELLDSRKKVVYTWDVEDPGYDQQGVKFDLVYDRNDDGDKHLTSQMYSVTIRPVYENVQNGTIVYGEIATAQDKDDFGGDINAPMVRGFIDPNGTNGKPIYRVDIDFNRADLREFPHPVSYFTIEYRPQGQGEWQQIPNMRVNYQGEMWVSTDESDKHPNAPTHEYQISGQYVFGNEPVANMSGRMGAPRAAGETDKAYAMAQPEDEAFPCVAYHVTEQDPTGNEYRVTAHYAASNDYIYKAYTKAADPLVQDFVVTAVKDIAVDGEATVKAWPIPTSGVLNIATSGSIEQIELYSVGGALAKQVRGNGDSRQSVDLSDVAAGVYMLRVNGGQPVRVVKK